MRPDSNAPSNVPHVGRFTPEARRVLELALREALSLGHNYIGPEHVLLALVRHGEGAAWTALHNLTGDTDRVRQEVLYQLQQQRIALQSSKGVS